MEKLLISACLLGVGCRYDGKTKPLEGSVIEALRRHYELIPVCPEQLGGLPTPRIPSERSGERVINREGTDVTDAFRRGAEQTALICRLLSVRYALFKANSPSCGMGTVYDGSFHGTLTEGNGVTAEVLLGQGIAVATEKDILPDGTVQFIGKASF